MYKIAFKEWINSEEVSAIHCASRKEATFLCEQLDKAGKTWSSGGSYIDADFWDKYRKDTCYLNNGLFGPINGDSLNNYPLYEFDEVDFKNRITVAEWFD